MFQASVIVSGSKGNALLVRTAEAAILIDAGVAARTIFASLDALGVQRSELKGIVISHEHSDHTKGVGAVARTLKIPVYANYGTYNKCAERIGRLPEPIRFFETGRTFSINDLVIHPFSSPHDAEDSCNFTIVRDEEGERKLGYATDLGFPTKLAINKLKNCTTLILESNHDERMLREGPYDWFLKQRIQSDNGHLSNIQAVGVVSQIMHHGLEHLILAHLSEINNDPHLAKTTMQDYLQAIRSDVRLLVASQYEHTPLINI